MKPMLAAFAAIILTAIAADLVLDRIGFSSAERNAGRDVRLDR